MRFGQASTTATVALFSTTVCFWETTNAWSRPLAYVVPPLSTRTSSSSSSALYASTMAPDEMAVSALQLTGKPVADGTIVSFFRGGLVAVQVEDNVTTTNEDGSSGPKLFPSKASTTTTPIKESKASSQGDDLLGRQVRFPNGGAGVVVAQRPPIVFVYTDMNEMEESMDGNVQVLDSMAKVAVTSETRMVDCFGRPIVDSLNVGTDPMERAIFSAIPQVKDIALINSPMLTGTTMMDTLAPIGKGQNMLVVGTDVDFMRGFACDFLATQLREGTTKCVYAVTRDRDLVMEELKQANLLDDVIVVATRDGYADADEVSQAAEATAVAATACAIGEAFALEKGQNVLVIVHTIDQHKTLWDATTRVLVDLYGVDAVVKADREGGASSEMRGFYSTLIQRSGKFNQKKGGGSMTLALMTRIPGKRDVDTDETTVYSPADFESCGDKIRTRIDLLMKKNIPLTAATLSKIDIPIPSASEGKRRFVLQHVDDLISMSDGQIWLDERLADAGQSPPMDPQRSITRIGIGADTDSRADAPAVRRVAEGVRLDLAQSASMDGAEVTVASTKQIRKRNTWLLAMHQKPGQGGRTLSESCVALLAASSGALDATVDSGALAGTEQGQFVVRQLLAHVKTAAPAAMKDIDESLDISPETRTVLIEAIQSFFS